MTLKNKKELYDREPLLPEVLAFAVSVGIISITSIQRRFGIGFPRAARIFDILEEEGFIDKLNNGPRKVLLSQEDLSNIYGIYLSDLETERHFQKQDTPQPKKGVVKLEELELDKIQFFDEFDTPVSEKMASELNKTIFDFLCEDALINLSSDFLLNFLQKKDYKIKFVRFDLDNINEIFRVTDKINSPVIYILDVANGSIIEILKQCNLLVKEGAIVMRKISAEKSKLAILY